MDRYIFLDFDGVMNTERSYKAFVAAGEPWRDNYGPFFDSEAVENLRHRVEATAADIVITSTWKYKGLDAMHTLWTLREMPGILLGVTPEASIDDYCTRGMEILKWLSQNGHDESDNFRYVILDDSSFFLPEQMPYLIKTSSSVGLTQEDAEKAIAGAEPGSCFQFLRTGYFCKDPDSTPDLPVYNRTVGLKDTFAKQAK